jgi:rhodanese-related sulfurtransferase
MGNLSINPEELYGLFLSGNHPAVIDVRRRTVFEQASFLLPSARWRPHMETQSWAPASPRELVVYCVHGHNVSQLVAGLLRSEGFEARFLAGGIEAWTRLRFPLVGKSPYAPADATTPSTWVTRWRPKIDRIACPWFITRFVDPSARFLFVEPEQVLAIAEELKATAFDIEGAPITHEGARCSFDALLDHFAIESGSLRLMADIIRGADTADLALTPQSAGLLALSLGISAQCTNDHMAMRRGFALYDALHAWANLARDETHNWPSGKRQ